MRGASGAALEQGNQMTGTQTCRIRKINERNVIVELSFNHFDNFVNA